MQDDHTAKYGRPRSFIRVWTICARLDWSRSTLYRNIRAGRFPPLVRISPGISALGDDTYADFAADPEGWAAKNKKA